MEDEWMDEWMDEWRDAWRDEWRDEWMDVCIHGWDAGTDDYVSVLGRVDGFNG